MPPVTRETLALRLRQNWLAKHPADTPQGGLDDSLTSLNWLQNLNILKMASPCQPPSPTPAEAAPSIIPSVPQSYTSSMQVNPNAILNMTNLPIKHIKQEPGSPPQAHYTHKMGGLVEIAPPANTAIDKIDYKSNPAVKPPYSYATLICMAMRESKKNKITLSGIYNWITENFMYYRVADPSWQNSIRHNLSLNKCFQKVPRRKDEPGKGGFWRINPEYQDMFVNGIFKKRRGSTGGRETPSVPAGLPKKIKRELEEADAALQPPSKQQKVDVKREPGSVEDAVFHLQQSDPNFSDPLDFSWGNILTQDIDIGGVRIKTEDVIDEKDEIASPITSFSPPPSDSNSDVALEDLLNTADLAGMDLSSDGPIDLSAGSGIALDLSITGTSIKPPDWWSESLNGTLKELMGEAGLNTSRSGLHTPIAPSPVRETDFSHPWAEDRTDLDEAIASFDTDIHNLFDIENVPSPNMHDS